MKETETFEWLKDVFGAKGNSQVCLVQRRYDGKLYHSWYANDEAGLQNLASYAVKNGNKENRPSDMYVRLTPTKKGNLRSRGKKEDTAFSKVLWAEIDDIETLDIIKPEPTYIIRSGGGFHLYWVLEEPIIDFSDVEGYNRTLVSNLRKNYPTLKIDSIFDCTRFLRVPNTKNFKDKNNPRGVFIYYKGRTYKSVGDLNIERTSSVDYVVGCPVDESEEKVKNVNDFIGSWIVSPFDVDSNPKLRSFTEKVVEDRSSHDFKVAIYMVKNGHNSAEIRYVLTRPGFSTAEKYLERVSVSEHSARYYVDTTIRNAWITANINIHLDDKGKKIDYKTLGDMILENNHLMRDGGELLRYKDGVYKPFNRLSALIIDILGSNFTLTALDTLERYITRKSVPAEDELEFRKSAICFLNGVYDLKTKQFLDHSTRYFFTTQFPVMFGKEYEKSGGRQKVLTFLEEILGSPGKVKTFLEYTSSIFCPGGYKPKKFLVLVGETDAGKSTLMNFLSNFAGGSSGAVCHTSFHQVIKESRFRLADFHEKLFNLQPDQAGTEAQDIAIIKQLTGDDEVVADRKNTTSIKFMNRARIFMPTNSMPSIRAGDEAFFKRMVVLNVEPKFKNPDPRILEKMNDFHSDFLGLLLDAYEDLEQRDFELYIDYSDDDKVQELVRESDPIAEFVHLHLRVSGTEEKYPNEEWTYLHKDRLYAKYRRHCKSVGRNPTNATNFNKRLREIERKQKIKFDRCLKISSPIHPLINTL